MYIAEEGLLALVVLPLGGIIIAIIEDLPHKQTWLYDVSLKSLLYALYSASLRHYPGQWALVVAFAGLSIILFLLATKSKKSP